MKLTPAQRLVLSRLVPWQGFGGAYITKVGCWMFEGKPLGRLAAHSIGRALERRGLVTIRRSGGDQWATLMFAATDAGIREAYAPQPREETKP